jgi:hypothetical protein
MNNKLTVSLALVAGLAGGMLTRFIAPAPVFAQAPAQTLPFPATPGPAAPAPITKEIRAESFVLLDPNDRVAGTFTAEPRGVGLPDRIILRDAHGHELWSVGGGNIRPLMANQQ